jgi:hypothetical protein
MFDFANEEHRRLLQAMLMTAADISAITRPWHVQHQVAEVSIPLEGVCLCVC